MAAGLPPPLDKEQADIMRTLADLVGKNRWNATLDPCVSPGWSGVRCRPSGGSSAVAELTLRGLGISSSAVFDSICRLKTLQVLDLSKNSIPTLPNQSFLCPMSAGLQRLNLSSNRLSGPLANFSVFPKLEILDLSFNFFSGNVNTELNSLSKLKSLNLSSNYNLKGGIPLPKSMLLTLEELVLSGNQFTGHIPKDLFQYVNLTMLDLSQNNLTGEATKDFGKLHKLQTLLLSGNNLSGQIPENLTTLQNLSRFAANQNNFIGHIPSGITNHVRMLDLSYNNLNGTIPSDLLSPSGLETVDLTGNQLAGSIPQNISSSLFRLRLGSNRLSGGIPDSIGDVLGLAYLELDNNTLGQNIPAQLGNCKNLTLLNLANNTLEGSVPSDFDNKDSPSRSRRHTTLIIIFPLAGTLIGMIVLATVAVYTYSKRVYRVEDEGVMDKNIPQIVNGRLITMNSIHTSAIEFMKAMEAVTNHNNIFLKTRFCTYYKAVMPNGSTYSVKKLNWSDKIFQIGSQEKFGREIEVLGKLTNSNVMVPLAYILTVDCAYLIYEHVYKGTVCDFLHGGSSGVLDWPSRYSIALGVAQGLTFLHGCTQPVLLLDLSTRTIHLKSTNEPQIGDIELYKIIDPSRSTGSFSAIAGTVGYIPPEYAYIMRLTVAGNIYSFGVILLELLTGKPAVSDGIELAKWALSLSSRPDQREQILDTRVSRTSAAVHSQMLSVLNIALSCVAFSPDARPKMRNVLRMLFNAK
ncbi:hypothetical protein EJB05_02541, partial [Eragrostis curvula]